MDTVYAWLLARWPFVLFAVVTLFVLMRTHWGFRVLAAVVLGGFCLLAIAGAVLAVGDLLRGGVAEPRFLVRLNARAEQARDRIRTLNKQRQEILDKIEQLQSINEDSEHTHAPGKHMSKSLALIQGFRDELALRATKLDFYKKSLRTLTELENKWRQERRLNELQRDLDKIRTPNKQEAAQMKALRAELDFESNLLSTYQELSKRIDKAETIEGARDLRRDLDQLLP